MARKLFDIFADDPWENAAYKVDVNFDGLYNQGVRFGTGPGEGMVAGLGGFEVVFDGITPQATLTHNLGVIPQGFIVLNQSGDETIKGRPTATDVTGQTDDWTTTAVYLVSATAQKARIFLVK